MYYFGARFVFPRLLWHMVITWIIPGIFCIVPDIKLDESGRSELSKNITKILNQLVDKKTYDKRLRPNYGGPPVNVGITIYVSSISAVSEVEMDYTLDIYLRQMWNDNRLEFRGVSKNSITIDVEYMKSIWVPDTFFPNEKKSFFHLATTHNSFLRIMSDGNVTTSQRLTVTASCPMELHLFPLDAQECSLDIESYGYSTLDIKYYWANTEAVTLGDITLPQFKIVAHEIQSKEVGLSTGRYSRLICRFLFSRSIGFYFIQIYLPSVLIVVISWVSFWLSRDATPARVALGVTTVLTMTTLMTTTNASMPKVSYIKSIDIYLGTCFMMVFASLVEYAVVSYLNKRLRMRREGTTVFRHAERAQSLPSSSGGEEHEDHDQFPAQTVDTPGHFRRRVSNRYQSLINSQTLSFSGLNNRRRSVARQTSYNTFGFSLSNQVIPQEMECDCRENLLAIDGEVNPILGAITTSRLVRNGSAPQLKLIRSKVTIFKKRKWSILNPSGIDKYSRLLFPLTFFIFNVLYWMISWMLREAATSFQSTA